MPKPQPANDRHQEVGDAWITSVQLPAGVRAQKCFLRQLQTALGNTRTLACLTPGPSSHVFVISQAAEQQARQAGALASDAAWDEQLRQWGARSVTRLSRNLLFAMTQRGSVGAAATPKAPAKLSDTGQPPRTHALRTTSALAPLFRGPFDCHLDERGAKVVKAWDLFATDPQFQGALPWPGAAVTAAR
jgi:hypothetical protein